MDDTRQARLEAALAASWDRETLAVYADHLVERGDPRGELIAIDLELEQRSTPELVARRASLLTAWLGKVPSDPHTPWIGDSFRLGFVERLELRGGDARALARVLDSPLAPYLKSIEIEGDPEHLALSVWQLAQARHEWLVELALECSLEVSGCHVDGEQAHALIAATPRLARLAVTGIDVVGSFPHPALRRLRVTGARAMPEMFEGLPPTVTALDFAFVAPSAYVGPPGAIPPLAMPGLRELDLSRNESSATPPWDEYVDDLEDYGYDDGSSRLTALGFLGSLGLRSQLARVVLPAIESEAELAQLEAIVGDMPALEEIAIARASYYRPPELTATRARFVRPAPWPWPRPESISTNERLHVLVPGARSGDEVTLDDAVRVMEQRFEALPADARYAWTRFWVFVDELRRGGWKQDASHAWTDDRAFPADLLVAAVEACDVGGSGGWRELRDQLRFRRPYPAGATVTIHARR